MPNPNWRADARASDPDWQDTNHKRGPAVRRFIPYPNTGGQDFRVVTRTVEGGVEIMLIEHDEEPAD